MRTGPPSEENYQTSRNKITNLKLGGGGGREEGYRNLYYTYETDRSVICLLLNMANGCYYIVFLKSVRVALTYITICCNVMTGEESRYSRIMCLIARTVLTPHVNSLISICDTSVLLM